MKNEKLTMKNIKIKFTKSSLISFKGQTLIELVLAMGLATLIFPALLTGFMSSREAKPQQEKRLQAVALLKQTENSVKAVRDNDWTTFAGIIHDAPYHSEIANNKWAFVSGTQTTNDLTQKIVMSNVSRDTNGNIVPSGGTNDPSTKKIEITISWTQPQTSSITSTMYLTRTTNSTYTDTTEAQFSAGTETDVFVTNTDGGEVTLGAGGGGGDWCSPSFSIATVDLPKSGVANAIAAIAGPGSDGSTVFAGTGENASGVSFATVDIPGNPPTTSIPATFDGYKTNAVFGDSSFAYLTTDNNSKEVVIINLTQYSNSPTNTKYLEVGSINLPGSINGVSIFVANNKAYVTSSDNKFYIYALSADRTSATLQNSDGLTLSGEGKKVLVSGNYAYIATGSTIYQMNIINIEEESDPEIVGRLSLGTDQSGVDVYVNTQSPDITRAYLATSQSSTQREFYIVNVENEENPTTNGLGRYETNGMSPTGVTVVTGNRAIIVGTGGTYQYQVIDITDETITNLSECGANAHLAYATGIRGVASILQDVGYAYSYVLTGDASSELKIILGGAGGTYTNSGEFESQTFDPSLIDGGLNIRAFNRFTANIVQPANTLIKFQIAVEPPNESNNCNDISYTYIGPNGTSDPNDQFTTNVTGATTLTGIIPLVNYPSSPPNYQNPGRCFRYKAILSTSDYTQAPKLEEITWNYSQ